MGKLDFNSISNACLEKFPSLLAAWLPGGRVNGSEYVCANLNGGNGRSLAINLRTGIWKDFATDDSGKDPVSLYAAINDLGQGEAAKRLIQELGLNGAQRRREIVANYDYYDAKGRLLFQVVRFTPKDFRQRQPDGKGGWVWNVKGIELVPYHLQAVLHSNEIYIVEGEKDADRLAILGLTASCNAQGAGKWRSEYAKWFSGKRVYILPDNDEVGIKHAHDVATSLGATAEYVKIVALPDLPNKGDVSDWLNSGLGSKEKLLKLVEAAPRWMAEVDEPPVTPQAQSSTAPPWQIARNLFPRKAFPWQVLPTGLVSSLQQLARSCASSANPLPGYVFCIMAAALGRTIAVEAKDSWQEPLIFWCFDIRDSGEGKTSPMWKLARLLEAQQKQEHARFDIETARREKLPKKERNAAPQPLPPRGFFASDVTIEGLHADLQGHPTGGVVLLLNEASSLLTSQGQYKAGKGADREAWLRLWDGNDVRIVRAGKTSYIHGARIQVAGGIQPAIFARVFSSEDGMYLADGTVFRGLFSYESSTHYGLTVESWRDESRDVWEHTLENALTWAKKLTNDTPQILRLSTEALALLISWRNDRDIAKTTLPLALRGFVPKSVSYALRLAGILHCLRAFAADVFPSNAIDESTMRQGIEVAEYYLGQAVDAVQLLTEGTAQPPVEVSDRTARLALVLRDMRNDTDNGRLAIGFIRERYNAVAPQEAQIQSPHAMGALVRSAGLSISASRHHANGKKGVYCLEWDEKTEKLIDECPHSSPSPQGEDSCDVSVEDWGKRQSSKSTLSPDKECPLRTPEVPSPSSRSPMNQGPVDYEDNEDALQHKGWAASTGRASGNSEQGLLEGEGLPGAVPLTNSLTPEGQPTHCGHAHTWELAEGSAPWPPWKAAEPTDGDAS